MPHDPLPRTTTTPTNIRPAGWFPTRSALADDDTPDPALHLGEAVLAIRRRLRIGAEMSDAHILASLKAIAAGTTPRERWLSAFNSTLGHWLALRGTDLNTALNTVVALVPPPTS